MTCRLPVEAVRTLVDLLWVQDDWLRSPVGELGGSLLGVVRIRVGGVEVHVDHVGLERLLNWMTVSRITSSRLVNGRSSSVLVADAISIIREPLDRCCHGWSRRHLTHDTVLVLEVRTRPYSEAVASLARVHIHIIAVAIWSSYPGQCASLRLLLVDL